MQFHRVLAEGGTQEVGSEDKFRDLRSAATIGAGGRGQDRPVRSTNSCCEGQEHAMARVAAI